MFLKIWGEMSWLRGRVVLCVVLSARFLGGEFFEHHPDKYSFGKSLLRVVYKKREKIKGKRKCLLCFRCCIKWHSSLNFIVVYQVIYQNHFTMAKELLTMFSFHHVSYIGVIQIVLAILIVLFTDLFTGLCTDAV